MSSAPPAYDEALNADNTCSHEAEKGPLYADVAGVDVGFVPTEEEKLQRLREVCQRHNIAGGAAAKLRQLEAYDIIIIADDSGSMRSPCAVSPSDPFVKAKTRWDELRSRVTSIVEIATCLDKDGIDIYFLNRPPALNVHDPESAAALFLNQPSGSTPLTAAYEQVLRAHSNSEKKLLILVATDGEPNNKNKFYQLLKNRPHPGNSPTTIMACTDNDREIAWVNDMDDSVPYLDVVDDYDEEKKEVLRVQGSKFRFSPGDYVVKSLLGALDPLYDNLDEKRLNAHQREEYYGGPVDEIYSNDTCCTIC
mmetsp:Transcript_22636/g.44838  ORF Transcript_22636/g.44838 Transcript_22636/m.44838 type:complete len:308 (-) Transcript_22636:189-1112(-)|eukprot:CAMPEP_0175146734 /NCGR_PEP_ID=MMETSP0087-20121206/15551_1 /TAXON_ID=136419 /ORGANISM="Unknown Unknown, Strain D1" /LENGTH=307 /DNA_ID=CAMNT_0016431745 /DNA_START=25 /DNA_END=948 /DNA_ORIENTATION=+